MPSEFATSDAIARDLLALAQRIVTGKRLIAVAARFMAHASGAGDPADRAADGKAGRKS